MTPWDDISIALYGRKGLEMGAAKLSPKMLAL